MSNVPDPSMLATPSASNSEHCALRSVNVSGELRHFEFGGNIVTTGFFKAPVFTQSKVHRLGIEGDAQGDPTVHGGLDKAVYCYPVEHYPGWEDLLQRVTLPPGSFAENLTTTGLNEEDLSIGDVLEVGSVVLQVTQPRSPCYKLQIKFERNDMVALFVQRSLPGWYMAVLQEGSLKPGDAIRVMSRAVERISVAEVWRYSLGQGASADVRRQILESRLLPDFWKERVSNHGTIDDM